jgi:hypothetical protein
MACAGFMPSAWFTSSTPSRSKTALPAIWQLYSDLKAYRCAPAAQRKADLEAEFNRIFTGKTGFVTPPRLLPLLPFL